MQTLCNTCSIMQVLCSITQVLCSYICLRHTCAIVSLGSRGSEFYQCHYHLTVAPLHLSPPLPRNPSPSSQSCHPPPPPHFSACLHVMEIQSVSSGPLTTPNPDLSSPPPAPSLLCLPVCRCPVDRSTPAQCPQGVAFSPGGMACVAS